MELAYFSQQTGHHFRFPRPALSALNPPRITEAVRDGIADLFMRTTGYLVDMKGHSAFCLEAQRGGFLTPGDLNALTLYPNGYGLHLLTKAVVAKAERCIKVDREQFLSRSQRQDLVDRLAVPFVDLGRASRIALACAEAGLITNETLAPVLSRVVDSGAELENVAEEALDRLLPEEQRLSRNLFDGEPDEYCVVETYIDGDYFFLNATERNVFLLDLPKCDDDFLPVHVLLFKTLDAMSSCLIPFMTPAHTVGPNGMFCYGIGEVYEALSELVDLSDEDATIAFLTNLDDASCPCELEYVGLSFYDRAEGEAFDPDMVERAATMLCEMHDVQSNYGYGIEGGQQGRERDIKQLIVEAQDSLLAGSKYQALLQVLKEALEICLQENAVGNTFHQSNHVGSAESGCGFFDTVWVEVRDRFPNLSAEALDWFNANAQECADICIGLPIDSAEVLAHTTIPIIERTQRCFALLRRIQLSLEAVCHA